MDRCGSWISINLYTRLRLIWAIVVRIWFIRFTHIADGLIKMYIFMHILLHVHYVCLLLEVSIPSLAFISCQQKLLKKASHTYMTLSTLSHSTGWCVSGAHQSNTPFHCNSNSIGNGPCKRAKKIPSGAKSPFSGLIIQLPSLPINCNYGVIIS